MIPNWMGTGSGSLRKEEARTPAGAGVEVKEEETEEVLAKEAEVRAWTRGVLKKPEGADLQHLMRRAEAEADQMTGQWAMTGTRTWTGKVRRNVKDQELQMKEAEAGQMTGQGKLQH